MGAVHAPPNFRVGREPRMPKGRIVYIVQDLETGQFLKPSEFGDVDFTSRIREAGRFTDPIEADETAQVALSGAPFDVFGFRELERGE